ncbi:ATPase [Sulfolobus sp. A20]|uniref:ATP-binding protein n=1 Tax=Saccharolobus sp. A20 TaxID=1891280 RepID=UPI000845F499|nr:ATP-binding protein [Sulfolobus sp. A20]AOL16950.1 ATPase [Sulfolobus sp. A20]TRM76062.1 ATP-binding protein [Sulfolobus sp. E5]TRM77382.1 ATP-binding protein [Sulfolobus sp. B5]TRM81082.1 ATP-binding protein [Sulfolobus sp. D5]
MEGEGIGVILQKSEANTLQGLLRSDEEISIGQLFMVEDSKKLTLTRVENFEFINEFFDEKGEIVKNIINEPSVYDILNMNTVIKVNLHIIRKYNHNSTPRPGSIIKRLPEIKDENQLLWFYGIKNKDGLIDYGFLAGSDIPLLLDLNSITMHIGIFGETGSGKSYNMRYIIHKFSNIKLRDKVVAIPMVIFDANGDYTDLVSINMDLVSKGRGWVKRYVLRDPKESNDFRLTIDLSMFTPRELAEFIMSLKYGQSNYNNLQLNFLEQILALHNSDEYNRLLGTTNGIDIMKEEINAMAQTKDYGITTSTARGIISALEIFRNKVINRLQLVNYSASFSENTLEVLWRNKGLAIIDFSAEGSPGVDITTKQLVVSYIARLVYNYLTKSKYNGSQRFIGLVIEEAQNYIPSNDYPINANLTKDILVTLATQGRKFGISLILVSQRPAFIDKYVLSMINTFFFHRIYHEDVRYVMSASGGLPESLVKNLTSLDTGYVVVSGLMSVMKSPVLVRIPWDSRLGSYAGNVERLDIVLSER